MTGTIVQWRPYSESFLKNVLIELMYPLRSAEEARQMFIKEYPASAFDELKTLDFDSKKRPDVYRAFENSGCIRTFKTY